MCHTVGHYHFVILKRGKNILSEFSKYTVQYHYLVLTCLYVAREVYDELKQKGSLDHLELAAQCAGNCKWSEIPMYHGCKF